MTFFLTVLGKITNHSTFEVTQAFVLLIDLNLFRMQSISATNTSFRITFLVLTLKFFLPANSNAILHSPETNVTQASLENRLHDLENLVQKLTIAIENNGNKDESNRRSQEVV